MWKHTFEILPLCLSAFVCVGGEGGNGGCAPLPTRPQPYCDPALLVLSLIPLILILFSSCPGFQDSVFFCLHLKTFPLLLQNHLSVKKETKGRKEKHAFFALWLSSVCRRLSVRCPFFLVSGYVCLSIFLTYLSRCLSLSQSVFHAFWVSSVCLGLSVYLTVGFSVCLSFCLSVFLIFCHWMSFIVF